MALRQFLRRSPAYLSRFYSTAATAVQEAEQLIASKLTKAFQPTHVVVEDISGGCGSMYRIELVSAQFAGHNKLKQHRMVNDCLAEEIKRWHGVQLTTAAPSVTN